MTTAVVEGVGVSIREAADALGVSPNAVRMRIRHQTIPAFKDGDQWRVILNGHTPTGWSPTSDQRSGPTSPPTSVETDHAPVSPVAQAQLATVIREAVAPFIEELGSVQRKLGATEQELAQERAHRERVEYEYETARKELAALRMIVRAGESKRATEEKVPSVAEPTQHVAEDAPRGFWQRLFGRAPAV
jgi:hypothetical protein